MNKKMSKRLFAMLMALVMVLSMLPVTVLAEGEQTTKQLYANDVEESTTGLTSLRLDTRYQTGTNAHQWRTYHFQFYYLDDNNTPVYVVPSVSSGVTCTANSSYTDANGSPVADVVDVQARRSTAALSDIPMPTV